MKQIESVSNPLIREVRRILNGRKKQHVLLEGKKLFQEAIQSGIFIQQVFVTREVWRRERPLLRKLESTGSVINLVSSSLLKVISDLETPTGLVGMAPRPSFGKPGMPKKFAAFLYSIRDPGNFGTIVRSAEAAECEFLIHTHDCVDPFQPKVIRASMGSIFRVPLFEVRDPQAALHDIKKKGVRLYALVPHCPNSIFLAKPQLPALLLIGSETKGLPNLLVDEKVTIPMAGRVESLNAAMAATVAFYWLAANMV